MAEQERWILARSAPVRVQEMSKYYDPLLARVLVSRKLDTPEQAAAFLSPPKELADPYLYKGMNQAVDRILQAIDKNETIVVYGDFDSDGVTATCLMVTALERLGANVQAHIPDRFDEGYGLNVEVLESLRKQGTDLVVTVDCGVRALKEAEHANHIGLDLIITDHHSVPQTLPPAIAIVDAKQSDCAYPFQDHAGVGVAYSTTRALFAEHNTRSGNSPLEPNDLLDLVAIGTVADIVPLTGENRLLVQLGLEQITASARPGVCALAAVAKTKCQDIDAAAIAFRLAPRLNAMGRLNKAITSFELLRAQNMADAKKLAETLDSTNRTRQDMLTQQVSLAESLIQPQDDRLFFAAHADFHEGIVGLVASRLMNHYYRPALVMRRNDTETTGSARSIEGFHITHALEACADLLVRFGGHAMAAGFTVENTNLDAFKQRLQAYADEHLTDKMLQPRVRVDSIIDLSDLTIESVSSLSALEPCGADNPAPTFATCNAKVEMVRRVGAEGRHLQMWLSQKGTRLKAIAFGLGELNNYPVKGDIIDIVYAPHINRWNGNISVDLQIETWRYHA